MKFSIRGRHPELLRHLPELLCYFFVALCALVAKRWVMSSANVFVMDDYSTLLSLSKITPKGVTLLPQTLYNNRPIGDLYYFLTANVFNLNYVLAHTVQFLIHVFNGCLVLYILRRFEINRWAAALAGCIFVAYPMSTMAVQWTAAIYDLLGGFFALSALALYVYHLHDQNRLKYFTATMLLLLYWLAVRTKEATIFLPVLLAMLALYDALHYRRFAELRRNLVPLAPVFVLFTIIFLTFINLKFSSVETTTINPQSQYFLDFSPRAMIRKFFEYLNLYSGRRGGWLAGILLAGLLLVPWRKLTLLWAMLGTVFLIILPMKNNTHQLYLYFPSFFLVLIFAETFSPVFNRLDALRLKPIYRVLCASAVFMLILGPLQAYFDYVNDSFLNKVQWLAITKRHRAQHRDFQKKVRTLAGNEKFLIYNVHHDADIFSTYGPGYSIRLYTGLPKLTFDLVEQPAVDEATKSKYHVVIRCNKGNLEFQKLMTGNSPVDYRVKFYDPENEK